MHKNCRIVIIGAGVFGLSTALQLRKNGFNNITVLDRHVPPVPDGSSVDISRVIRFDYADPVYANIAKESFDLWTTTRYKDFFFPSPFTLVAENQQGRSYIEKCTKYLTGASLPWVPFETPRQTKEAFPTLTGPLGDSDFSGYCNFAAGWVDAQRAITSLRDECSQLGITFLCGSGGTMTGYHADITSGKVQAVRTKDGESVHGDLFIMATGAWTSRLVPMYNSILATGQVVGFLKLTEAEVNRYKDLPIYINFSTGWFCFPPHEESKYLKFAVHGYGYTNTAERGETLADELKTFSSNADSETVDALSAPPTRPAMQRANFAPLDGIRRLREGLGKILPELSQREFDRTAVCWYTDTPSGDFILDYHPDHANLFLATGGSGHAFKFLPVLGKYAVEALSRNLPEKLVQRWRFRREYRDANNLFDGDGSRGGPSRREFTAKEKGKL
ncbi:FAD dependent oxidoreductase [Thozetella sp. PMI_491]|nr:FAD dependent oxidoreductase [Thozetella sp. PMI_491]